MPISNSDVKTYCHISKNLTSGIKHIWYSTAFHRQFFVGKGLIFLFLFSFVGLTAHLMVVVLVFWPKWLILGFFILVLPANLPILILGGFAVCSGHCGNGMCSAMSFPPRTPRTTMAHCWPIAIYSVFLLRIETKG
jgi:hypothetical protein